MSASPEITWPIDDVNKDTGLPLEGIRILDLSRVLAGPLATMVASDLGADVIKVESPQGDPVRGLAPPSIDGIATYYLAVNRNRRSVVADLGTEEGRELVRNLARCADGVVENYLPSQSAALGIDELRDQLTDVVWVSVRSAASGGPLGDSPSFDLLAQAQSGLMGVTGSKESGPLKMGAPVADVVTGLYACIALLTGLYERVARPERDARRYEAPLLESAMASLINQAAGFLATKSEPSLSGNEHPSIAPYAPYAAKDSEIVIAVGTERQWHNLCSVLGSKDLAEDFRFASNTQRATHRDELREAIESRLSEYSAGVWQERLLEQGIPCAVVNDVPTALSQEQIANGDLIEDVAISSGSIIKMVGSPLRIDGVRPSIRRRPPGLGEHTEFFNPSED